MWIQDLFLDGYLEGPDGSEDLALHGLSDTSNIVRADSPQAADLLGVSLGALLGNDSLPRGIRRLVARPRGGSLIVRHGAESLDLCRLRRPDTTLGPRQVLHENDGAPKASGSPGVAAIELREAFGETAWWSLFTDLLPAAQRVVEWQGRGWWQRLAVVAGDHRLPAREPLSSSSQDATIGAMPAVTMPAVTTVSQSSAMVLVPHERGVLSRVSLLDANNRPATSVDHVGRPLIVDVHDTAERQWWKRFLANYSAWRDASSSAPTQEASSAPLPAASFPSLADLKLREIWLHARHHLAQLDRSIAERSNSFAELRAQVAAWQKALALKPAWERCEAMEHERPPEFAATPEDFARLQRIERRLLDARQALRKLRDEPQPQQAQPAQADPATDELHAILRDWPTCEAAAEVDDETRSDQFPRLADDTFHQLLLESEAAVASLVADVRAASHRLRSTRHDLANVQFVQKHLATFPRAATVPPEREIPASDASQASSASVANSASDATRTTDSASSGDTSSGDRNVSLDERRESLHRQIRQLRDETQQLLARQILSRHAILGIGLLFSTGAAILLAAIFVDLEGAEMATGIMGLTCLMASGLLKASFERAPSEQLRRQRLRIVELLRELDQLPIPWEDYLQDHASATGRATGRATVPAAVHTATMASPGGQRGDLSDDERRRRAERACEDAWHAWQTLLEEHQFLPDTRPAEVVRALRAQYELTRAELQRQSARPMANGTSLLLHSQLERWTERAAAWCDAHWPAFGRTDESLDRSPDDWLELLRAEATRRDLDAVAATSRATPMSEAEERIASLQSQVRQLKRRRQKLLDAAGVEQTEQYEAAILALDHWRQTQEQARRAREEFDAQLATCGDDEGRVRGWLEDRVEIADELRAAEATLARTLAAQQTDQVSRAETQRVVDEALRRRPAEGEFVADGTTNEDRPAHRRRLAEPSEVERSLVGLIFAAVRTRRAAAWAERRIVAHPATRATVPPLASHGFLLTRGAATDTPLLTPTTILPAGCLKPTAVPAPAVTHREIPLRPLLRATAWLRALLQQPDLQLLVHAGEESGLGRIAWVDRVHGRRPLTQLEPPLQELTTTCLQWALAEELRQEAGSPPWIVTDRSFDLPEPLALRLAERLRELAADGQQLVVISHRGPFAHWCQAAGFHPVAPERRPHPGSPAIAPETLESLELPPVASMRELPETSAPSRFTRGDAFPATTDPAMTAPARQAFLAGELLRALAQQLAGEQTVGTRTDGERPTLEHADSKNDAWAELHEELPLTTEALSTLASVASTPVVATAVMGPATQSSDLRYPVVEVNWDRAE